MAKNTQDYLNTLQALGYWPIRWNESEKTAELGNPPRLLSETLEAAIYCQMADSGFTTEKRVMNAIVAEAGANAYHPIDKWLNELPTWDGKSRISQVGKYFTLNKEAHPKDVQDRNGKSMSIFELFFRRWIVGAVARVERGMQNFMLVLAGPQEIGKSRFARWLCVGTDQAPGIGRQYHVESTIIPDNKDHMLWLTQNLIWECAELGSTTRKADVEGLKAFLTYEQPTVRPVYARRAAKAQVRCSFIGTFNPDGNGFLHDKTGNRRFAIVTVDAIDEKLFSDVDVQQLWAEAVTLYRTGEPWRIEGSERNIRDAANDDYTAEDPMEGLIRTHFDLTGDDQDILTATDIIDKLKELGWANGSNLKSATIAVGNAAKLLGLGRIQKRPAGSQTPVRYYTGIKLKPGP